MVNYQPHLLLFLTVNFTLQKRAASTLCLTNFSSKKLQNDMKLSKQRQNLIPWSHPLSTQNKNPTQAVAYKIKADTFIDAFEP